MTLLATLAAIAALLFFYRGDAEGAARTANLEIELQLEAGERVERRVPVMQRHWWDFFRLTHGVLAATDRRLMYVGVPPEDVLPHVPEPTEFIAITYPYNRPLLTRQHRVFVGTRPGLELVGPSDRTSFGYMPRDRERVDSVLAILDRKQAVLRAAAQAERRATDAALAAARQPIYHLVQRGEALGLIARRYGVSTDSLMAWNNLSSPRITAGRRLLVKPGT
ncbi:MAG: LysM peptidoglycan-binding domain-containing protein [Gemmatimonadaceae bacterium]